jgi:hypothetical protein
MTHSGQHLRLDIGESQSGSVKPSNRPTPAQSLFSPLDGGAAGRVAPGEDRCAARELAELERHDVPEHTQRLIRACRDLDRVYPDRRLWAWAHMLGFRGHFSTKSRHYSVALGSIRQARADFRAAEQAAELGIEDLEPDTVLVLADWQYAGHGHTPGESALAAGIARDLQLNRDTAREALTELERGGVW